MSKEEIEKALSEGVDIGELPAAAVIQAIVYEAEVAPEETPEQRDERLKREDYARRNAEAVKDREAIFKRNGLLQPEESLTMDAEAAIRQRCCF